VLPAACRDTIKRVVNCGFDVGQIIKGQNMVVKTIPCSDIYFPW